MPQPAPEREGWLRQVMGDLNPFHIVFVLYAIPIALGFLLLCLGFVVLALSDAGFAQFALVTLIVGMIIGLPQVLRP
jgi:hypothetical protein